MPQLQTPTPSRLRRFGDVVLIGSDRTTFPGGKNGDQRDTFTFRLPSDEQFLILGGKAIGGGLRSLVTSFTQGSGALERVFRAPVTSVSPSNTHAKGVPLSAVFGADNRPLATGQSDYGDFTYWPGHRQGLSDMVAALANYAERSRLEQGASARGLYERAMAQIASLTGGHLDVACIVAGGYASDQIVVTVADGSAHSALSGVDIVSQLVLVGISLGPSQGIDRTIFQHNAPYWCGFAVENFVNAESTIDMAHQLFLERTHTEWVEEVAISALCMDYIDVSTPRALAMDKLGHFALTEHSRMDGFTRFVGQVVAPLSAFTGGAGRKPQRLSARPLRHQDFLGFDGIKRLGSNSGDLYVACHLVGMHPTGLNELHSRSNNPKS
jgi:hypothetical protein